MWGKSMVHMGPIDRQLPPQQLLRSSAAAVFFFPLVKRGARIGAHAPIVGFGVEWNIVWVRFYRTYVSKILTDILFYVPDIPHFRCTICGTNLIKWCQRDHLLEGILKGLRVQAAGLKLFIVSIDDLACHLCIGCSLSLGNNWTKLCAITITDIFGMVPHCFRLVSSKYLCSFGDL